jgi:hypothetical protein
VVLGGSGEEKYSTRFWWEQPKKDNNFEGVGIDGRIVSKYSLKNLDNMDRIHFGLDKKNWLTSVNTVIHLRVP